MLLVSIHYMWTLVAVMLLAGSFGGVINYFLTRTSDPENTTILRSITIGVGASFLVPLFLNMISSNLIDSIKGTNDVAGDNSKLLVLAGFCLIAAISSSAFIQTLSDRVLNEARAAKKQAEEAKAEAAQAKDDVAEVQASVDPIINKETEPEPAPEKFVDVPSTAGLSDKVKKILDAFARSTYIHRSLKGLGADTGIPEDELQSLLAELVSKGLVAKRESKTGPKWFMTQEGLNAAVSL